MESESLTLDKRAKSKLVEKKITPKIDVSLVKMFPADLLDIKSPVPPTRPPPSDL